ncbi:MAG: hypothetical protein JO020_13460 [Chloroflexi bacterium]|nr:hypothetical protein [Chloroflexota bacterium]
MSADDLNTFLSEFSRAMLDPTAPLPTLWPTGALGVFLVFATQIGAGIPIGVVMARDAGLNVLEIAGLYLASDVLLAVICEPVLMVLRWLAARVYWLAALGQRLSRLSGATGLNEGRVKGPLGLVLFSFVFAPAPARAASEAAGHGPISGWTLAIIGDMAYFGVVMASTLLVIQIFGDSRLTLGPLILAAWLLPMLVQRLQRKPAESRRAPIRLAAATVEGPEPSARVASRRSVSHDGRRRRSSRGAKR